MIEYKGERTAMMEARKHAAWYMRGLNGAAELRRMCGMIDKKDDVIDVVRKAMELNQNI
jgi:tRNA-dihydrouridine synthase